MNLKQLRKFVVVADEGNFTRASAILHLSQPALSKQIALLEEQLGASLLDRASRPMSLTEAGRRLYAGATDLLAIADRLETDVRRLGHGVRRTLTIAFAPTVAYAGISDVMKRLAHDQETTRIEWREMPSCDQPGALREGDIDIAFGPWYDTGTDIVSILTREERLFLAVPRDDILSSETGPVHMSVLHGRDLIVYPGSASEGFAKQTLTICREVGAIPRQLVHVAATGAALAYVAAGKGLAVIPASSRHLRPDVAYRLLSEPQAKLSVFMCYRTDEDTHLIEGVKDVVRAFFADGAVTLEKEFNTLHPL